MASNVYECMLILDSNRYARDPGGVAAQIPHMVESCGGEMLASRLWNEQRLAYPIQGQRKGTYWLTYFRLDAARLATLRRQCEINENILRFLILKVEPRIVDALVAHAQAAPAPAPAPAPEPVAVAAADLAEGEGVDAIADVADGE